MKILAIDTSCDDTCIALLKIKDLRFKLLSNIISSQVKLHAKYGGVYPSLAKREHIKNLPKVYKEATKRMKTAEIDLVAVTNGPGLEPCLWQGINFAKELAEKLRKPVIPVNHIEGHIAANFIYGGRTSIKFPAMCLVASGGHTQLILMRGIGKYKLIGETRDDAVGECFDKTARILGLDYPGGPAIAKMAACWTSDVQHGTSDVLGINLPRPMINQKNYDFSFSGLKTAVLYKNQKQKTKNKQYIQAMCHEIQQAIIDVLIHKTLKAAKDFRVKSIILGGGVAANDELRKQFESKVKGLGFKVNFLVPPKNLCTDNAAMVAVAAYFYKNKKANLLKLKADGNLRIC